VIPRIEELLEILDREAIRYLLIGGQAMRLAGMPRFSMDWDFYIPPKDLENLAKLNSVLEEELDNVRFYPNTPKSIPVTLGTLDWDCSATARSTGIITQAVHGPSGPNFTTEFPVWLAVCLGANSNQ
jgi:hypothetical protein